MHHDRSVPPLNVLFVLPSAYPAAVPTAPGSFGGLETRGWLFARTLARRDDVRVSLIVDHPHASRTPFVEQVRIIPQFNRVRWLRARLDQSVQIGRRFPFLRVHRWKPSLLWQLPAWGVLRAIRGAEPPCDSRWPAIAQSACDVVLTFGVTPLMARAVSTARAVGLPSVLFLGSDGDLAPQFRKGGTGRDIYGTPAAVGAGLVASATRIIAQTGRQRDLLRKHFDREATVIKNPIDVDTWVRRASDPLPHDFPPGPYVLWIGRAENEPKRPHLCIELARRCPDLQFLMLMNGRIASIDVRLRHEAPPNITIIRSVPFDQMPAVFSRAFVFLNTSAFEGFPNVFLQAAVSGVPIISLRVGDAFLSASGAGLVCDDDLDMAAAALRREAAQPREERWRQHVRAWVQEHHSAERQAARLLEVLREAASTGESPR